MKKFMTLMLVIIFATFLIVGCANQAEPATTQAEEKSAGTVETEVKEEAPTTDGAKNIALVIKNETDPYWIDYIDGLEDACEEYGFNYTLFSNSKETDIEDQIELCRTVISQKFDLIVLSPLDSTAIAPIILECNEAKIPVFIIDTAADKVACEEIGAMYDYFVTGEDYYAGMMGAQMLVDALGGTGEIAILEGMSGSSTAALIQDGFMKIFDANEGITIATSETANWARSEGFDVTTNILAAHPNINGLIAANDEMAQGAIQAIATAGLTDQITVVTLNYTQDCIDTMKSGQLYGTVDKGPYRQGYQAIVRANDYFNGVEFELDETVPPIAYLADAPETPSTEYDVADYK